MNATKIEIRTAAQRAGRTNANGVWEPAGQLVATVWLEEPGQITAAEIAAQITTLHGEAVLATVEGRQEMPVG